MDVAEADAPGVPTAFAVECGDAVGTERVGAEAVRRAVGGATEVVSTVFGAAALEGATEVDAEPGEDVAADAGACPLEPEQPLSTVQTAPTATTAALGRATDAPIS